ncbi:uncharacterized protein LOC142338130 [Convolutriloba macropyga]|uniref:uncharacterized protein LOC142338130 n=1 Tax=Convolutriloba macropyga TaxID=536237 RepID=UPI003F51EFF6
MSGQQRRNGTGGGGSINNGNQQQRQGRNRNGRDASRQGGGGSVNNGDNNSALQFTPDEEEEELGRGIDEFDLERLRATSQYAEETEDEEEEENEGAKDDFSHLVRMLYQLPINDKDLAFNMSVFVNYMREHKIDSTLSKVLLDLLADNQLPYNPHAGFHRALKVENQAYFFNKIPDEQVMNALNMATYLSDISYLAGIKKFTNVWGLASVIKTMSPVRLKEYEWLFNSVTPDKTTLVYHHGFTAQCIMSLVGPAAFCGTFYPEVHTLHFRLHYVVMGADLRDLALRIYAESVLNDIFNAMNQTQHLLIGLYIENGDCGGYTSFETDRFFTPDFIVKNEELIFDELTNAAKGAQKVSSEFIFLVDPELMVYRRGQKQYECYFIDQSVDNQDDPEEIYSFAEYFMASVYEGCFVRKHEAEAYMGLFCSRQLLVNFDRPPKGLQANLRSNYTENRRIPFKPALDSDYAAANTTNSRQPRAEVDEPIERSEQIRINKLLERDVGFKSRVLKSRGNVNSKQDPRRANREADYASNSRFLSGYSEVELERPLSPVWNHGIAYPENRDRPMDNPARGVKISSEEREEDIRPDSRLIKGPLRTHFERDICKLDHRNREFFEQVHKLILLNLMDKSASDQAMLIALFKILHGHGWRVFCVMMLNVSLQEAIFAYRHTRVSVDIINSEFKRYRDELNFVLGSDLQEKSSDYVSLLMRYNYILSLNFQTLPGNFFSGHSESLTCREEIKDLASRSGARHECFQHLKASALIVKI